METKESYQQIAEEKLKELNSKIENLSQRADRIDSAIRHQYLETIEDLKFKREAVIELMEEFKHAQEDRWISLKDQIDEVKTELESGIDATVSRFP
jgi:frataxin-like iron-binding protein CyaY